MDKAAAMMTTADKGRRPSKTLATLYVVFESVVKERQGEANSQDGSFAMVARHIQLGQGSDALATHCL